MTINPLSSCASLCGHALIRLTEAKDIETLNQRLIGILSNINPCSCITLYEGRHRSHHPKSRILAATRCSKFIGCTHHQHPPIIIPLRRSVWHAPVATLSITLPHKQTLHLMSNMIPEIYMNLMDHLERGNRDALTRLHTRRAFNEQAELLRQHRRRQDSDHQNLLAVIDIDHFKQINDNLGHITGDQVLREFAQQMRHSFRSQDLLYRFGGEEFIVILKDTDLRDALETLERFRKQVAEQEFAATTPLTITIGATPIQPSTNLDTLLEQADQALYFGKQNGRNQLNLCQQLVKSGKLATHA